VEARRRPQHDRGGLAADLGLHGCGQHRERGDLDAAAVPALPPPMNISTQVIRSGELCIAPTCRELKPAVRLIAEWKRPFRISPLWCVGRGCRRWSTPAGRSAGSGGEEGGCGELGVESPSATSGRRRRFLWRRISSRTGKPMPPRITATAMGSVRFATWCNRESRRGLQRTYTVTGGGCSGVRPGRTTGDRC
jgi:hypothetical protein